jgi:C4-dicarboxylate-specific signal transduction histidine kinase
MLLLSGTPRVVGQSALAIFAIVAVAIGCVRLDADEPSLTLAALIYLVIVVFLSLNGSFIAAACVSTVAVVFLQDLATLPLFSFGFDEPFDGVALAAFLTTALVITRLVSKMRLSLERLRISLEDLRRAEEESRQAENALARAQTELARVARVTTLGQLAASIAHEVNQPLTAIIADSSAALNWLALEQPDLEQARAALLAIAKDGARAAKVLTHIRGMLSSRSAQPYRPCDVCTLIRDTLPLLRVELARHAIRIDTPAPERPLMVLGDAIQLQQVLLNLLLNAAEAAKDVTTQRRCVIVTAELHRNESRGNVLIDVRDTGVGIGDVDLSRVFEPFYTTKAGGLGMGLSVGKTIVERHAGQLWVSRNADYGVTFHISIPALP